MGGEAQEPGCDDILSWSYCWPEECPGQQSLIRALIEQHNPRDRELTLPAAGACAAGDSENHLPDLTETSSGALESQGRGCALQIIVLQWKHFFPVLGSWIFIAEGWVCRGLGGVQAPKCKVAILKTPFRWSPTFMGSETLEAPGLYYNVSTVLLPMHKTPVWRGQAAERLPCTETGPGSPNYQFLCQRDFSPEIFVQPIWWKKSSAQQTVVAGGFFQLCTEELCPWTHNSWVWISWSGHFQVEFHF